MNQKSYIDIFTPITYDGLIKKRLGSDNDGGYIISSDIKGYDIILSGGAGDNISFEENLVSLIQTECMIYDHTVNVKTKTPYIKHIKQKLDKNTTSFFDNLNKHNHIFLKLDIEGGEFELLSVLKNEQLQKIKQIVIEIHDCYNSMKIKLLNKLFVNHKLIHLHPNNCCGLVDFHNIKFPKVVELTFVRNSEIPEFKLNDQCLPTELDQRNVLSLPEIILDYHPFVQKH